MEIKYHRANTKKRGLFFGVVSYPSNKQYAKTKRRDARGLEGERGGVLIRG
jgi:hypothetical protein